jgi:hypothetical protein
MDAADTDSSGEIGVMKAATRARACRRGACLIASVGCAGSSHGPSTSLRVVSLSNQRRLSVRGEGREEEGQILAMLGISDRRFQISDLRFEI